MFLRKKKNTNEVQVDNQNANQTYDELNSQHIDNQSAVVNFIYSGNCGDTPVIDTTTRGEIFDAAQTKATTLTVKCNYLKHDIWWPADLIKLENENFRIGFDIAKESCVLDIPSDAEKISASVQGYNPETPFLFKSLQWHCGDCNPDAFSKCLDIEISGQASVETGFPGMQVELTGNLEECVNLFTFVHNVFNTPEDATEVPSFTVDLI